MWGPRDKSWVEHTLLEWTASLQCVSSRLCPKALGLQPLALALPCPIVFANPQGKHIPSPTGRSAESPHEWPVKRKPRKTATDCLFLWLLEQLNHSLTWKRSKDFVRYEPRSIFFMAFSGERQMWFIYQRRLHKSHSLNRGPVSAWHVPWEVVMAATRVCIRAMVDVLILREWPQCESLIFYLDGNPRNKYVWFWIKMFGEGKKN